MPRAPAAYAYSFHEPPPHHPEANPAAYEAQRHAKIRAKRPPVVDLGGPPLPAPNRYSRTDPVAPPYRHGFWQPIDSAMAKIAAVVRALWQGACAAVLGMLVFVGLRAQTAAPKTVPHTPPRAQMAPQPAASEPCDPEPFVTPHGMLLIPVDPPDRANRWHLHNRRIYARALTDGRPYRNIMEHCAVAAMFGLQLRRMGPALGGNEARGDWEEAGRHMYFRGKYSGVIDVCPNKDGKQYVLFDGPINRAHFFKTLRVAPHLAQGPHPLNPVVYERHSYLMLALQRQPGWHPQVRKKDSVFSREQDAKYNPRRYWQRPGLLRAASAVCSANTRLGILSNEDLLMCAIADANNTPIGPGPHQLEARLVFDMYVRDCTTNTVRHFCKRQLRQLGMIDVAAMSDAALRQKLLEATIYHMRRLVGDHLEVPRNHAALDAMIDYALAEARQVGVRVKN